MPVFPPVFVTYDHQPRSRFDYLPRRSKKVEELQAARELHAAAERKLAESAAALDGRFEEVHNGVQVRRNIVEFRATRLEGSSFSGSSSWQKHRPNGRSSQVCIA